MTMLLKEKVVERMDAGELKALVRKHLVLHLPLEEGEMEGVEREVALRVAEAEEYGFSKMDVLRVLFAEQVRRGHPCGCPACEAKAAPLKRCDCVLCKAKIFFSHQEAR